MRPDTIIVTGGNAPYFPLIEELWQSIRAACPPDHPTGHPGLRGDPCRPDRRAESPSARVRRARRIRAG